MVLPTRVIPVQTSSIANRSLRVDGLTVTDASYPPLNTLAHAHQRAMCTLTLEGAWIERRGGELHRCLPGILLTKAAGEVHTDSFGPPGIRVLMIELDSTPSAEPLQGCFAVLERAGTLQDAGAAALGRRVARELADPDPVTPLVIEGLLLELLGTAARRHQTPHAPRIPAWLERARDLLHASLLSPTSVTELARAAGVHPVRLTRGFRRHFGRSPGAYLRRARLEWAATQLTSTQQPLAEIAARAGFADQSHFTRVFRRYTGVTPGLFRLASQDGRSAAPTSSSPPLQGDDPG